MPALEDIRRAGEADLRDILASSDDYTRRVLRAALRRYGSVQNIPESVWQDVQSHLETKSVAALYLLMISADSWTSDEIERQGVGRKRLSPQQKQSYGLVAASRASRMALQSTDALRDRLGRTIQDRQLSTERSPVGELDLGDIDQALDDALNDKRREKIAVNETTGGMSAGQRGAGRRHEPGAGASVEIDLVWETHPELSKSGQSCPRCDPLNGTTEDVWGLVFPNGPGQEAHDHCNCSLRPRVRAKEVAAAA